MAGGLHHRRDCFGKMPTRVVHVRKEDFDFYIGRAFAEFGESEWHNPFKIEPGCGRKCVIEKFKQYILQHPELLVKLRMLKDKTLGCWCKPKACHGDVLAELADKCESS
jgi:hypothetical protein